MLTLMETASDFRKQILRAVVIPPLMLLVLWAVSSGLVVHLLSELDRVRQADRLIARANAASRLLVDREAALRAYLVAGSPDLLKTYRQADTQLGACFDELSRLVRDDHDLSSRLTRLRGLSETWGHQAGATIDLRAGAPGPGRNPPGEPGGDRRLGEILASMTAFLDAERADRDRLSDATQSRSWSVLAACSGSAIALGLILAYSSQRRLVRLCRSFEAAIEVLEAKSDRQERENLSLLSEAMKYYAIFTLDADGLITSWNGNAERILGYRDDDVMARRPSHFYSDEDVRRDVFFRDMEWASVEGRVEDERWLTRKDGFRFKAHVAMMSIRDANGILCGYTNVIHEVADQPL